MQLKNRRQSLTAATLTLLGTAAAGGAQADGRSWDIDSAVLVYSESGGRVQAIEPVVKGTLDLGGERYFSAKLVFDSLTGASPNGATPASTPQTFTGASGGGRASVTPAFETPLDDRFKDTRVQGVLDYSFPVSANGTLGFGGTVSSEYDFLSAGANLRYAHDLFQNNTTLSVGLSVEADQIDPVGGAPEPLTRVATGGGGGGDDEGEGEGENEGGGGRTQSKTVTDLVLGLTQVLGPRSLLQLNYSLSASSGYQNDPYKLLSVVGSDGEPDYYVWESRPDSRLKHALFARYKLFSFNRDVVDASYRYMTDDWGIASSTIDLTYRWNFAAHHYLEPHLRWYTQTAADFYRVALYDGEDQTVAHASADPRLGAFDAWTAGVKLGGTLNSGSDWSARLEWYQQQSKLTGVPAQAADGLSKFDLQPDLSAVMFTVGYRFKW
ncbi:DUF3570 domain-containing protein [Fontimonas sp. SYSU GA230001]|uniref:DUF3570 domain-containing protein n=1 Tax=Fontimonas sp. SYSU GA230001 TaxID=3142450 RepID=UPI0032B54CF5